MPDEAPEAVGDAAARARAAIVLQGYAEEEAKLSSSESGSSILSGECGTRSQVREFKKRRAVFFVLAVAVRFEVNWVAGLTWSMLSSSNSASSESALRMGPPGFTFFLFWAHHVWGRLYQVKRALPGDIKVQHGIIGEFGLVESISGALGHICGR